MAEPTSSRIDEEVLRSKQVITVVLDKASLETVKMKSGQYCLLNCDDHQAMMKKGGKNPADYRPDILHQELLALLDSPLNKVGKLKVYIHSASNVLIEVNPKCRIPRTYKRFAGLMGRWEGGRGDAGGGLLRKSLTWLARRCTGMCRRRLLKRKATDGMEAGDERGGARWKGTIRRPRGGGVRPLRNYRVHATGSRLFEKKGVFSVKNHLTKNVPTPPNSLWDFLAEPNYHQHPLTYSLPPSHPHFLLSHATTVQLLHKLKVRSADGKATLLKVIKNPITRHLPAGCKCYGFSVQGTLYNPSSLACALPEDKPVVFVLGAMAAGHITVNDHPYVRGGKGGWREVGGGGGGRARWESWSGGRQAGCLGYLRLLCCLFIC